MGEKDFHQISPKEALARLNVTKESGLNTKEIEERKSKYGANEIDAPKESSLLDDIVDAVKEPMMLILLVAAAISFFIGQTADGIGIVCAIIIGASIGIIVEGRSKKAADELKKVCGNIHVKIIRQGEVGVVTSSELVPGDIVMLQSGDKVPADGRLLESSYLKLDESMLTGESKPVLKNETLVVDSDKAIPADKKNMLFSGTLVTEGSGTMLVTNIGSHTEIGQISQNLSEDDIETPLQQKLGDLGTKISKISSLAALILFVFMVYIKWPSIKIDTSSVRNFLQSIEPIKEAFVVCVALIVAAVPEGLPTMINMTLALTMKKMAKINALVRKKEACETIGSVSVICSDKTGTLTQNKMTVVDTFIGNQYINDENLSRYFIENCALNSTANIDVKNSTLSFIGNTTECSALQYLYNRGIDYKIIRKEAQVLRQFEFNSSKKKMSTLVSEGEKYILYIKGAPERILSDCRYIDIDGKLSILDLETKRRIEANIKELQREAKRVLALSYKILPKGTRVSNNMDKDATEHVFIGFIGIMDPLRTDVKEAVSTAKKLGVQTKILTGDNIHTATAIANQLRLFWGNKKAVTSAEIDAMDKETLYEEIDNIAVVARSTPETKMRIVQALKAKNHVVAVTGDGINDAPALVKSDVGIAMGITGTEVSQEASDIILRDDSFSTIIRGIKWGRGIYDNFQRFIQFQLTVNIVAFLVAILSIICGFKLPFTTIQLLWVNIIMDGPPALSLGLEPLRENILRRKPIDRNASIITSSMLNSMLFNAFIMVNGILIISRNPWIIAGRALNLTPGSFDDKLCGTILFSVFAFFALWNAFNCREFSSDSIFPHLFENKLALQVIIATSTLQIIFVQFASDFFNAVPLNFVMWIRIILYTSSVVIVNEVIKFIIRLLSSSKNNSFAAINNNESVN